MLLTTGFTNKPNRYSFLLLLPPVRLSTSAHSMNSELYLVWTFLLQHHHQTRLVLELRLQVIIDQTPQRMKMLQTCKRSKQKAYTLYPRITKEPVIAVLQRSSHPLHLTASAQIRQQPHVRSAERVSSLCPSCYSSPTGLIVFAFSSSFLKF